MKIYLTAIIKSKPGFTTQVEAVLQNMVTHSRLESGCLQYDLHRVNDDVNTFIFYEIWQNEEALTEHNLQPYIQDFVNIVPEKLIEAPLIYKMELL